MALCSSLLFRHDDSSSQMQRDSLLAFWYTTDAGRKTRLYKSFLRPKYESPSEASSGRKFASFNTHGMGWYAGTDEPSLAHLMLADRSKDYTLQKLKPSLPLFRGRLLYNTLSWTLHILDTSGLMKTASGHRAFDCRSAASSQIG